MNIVDLGYPVLDALVFLLPKSSNFIVLQEGDIFCRSLFVAVTMHLCKMPNYDRESTPYVVM